MGGFKREIMCIDNRGRKNEFIYGCNNGEKFVSFIRWDSCLKSIVIMVIVYLLLIKDFV